MATAAMPNRPAIWFKPWTWIADPKWPLLSGLPTVPFRAVFLCALDAMTLWWFWHTSETVLHAAIEAMRAGKVFNSPETLVLGIQGAWLAFLAGAHGFAYAGYKTKRNTSWDGNVEEDRGGSSETAERPIVNPASVRAANQAKMQGSGTTADAPAIAVPTVIVPATAANVAAQAPTVPQKPVIVPQNGGIVSPPANIEAGEGGTPAPPESPPEGMADATAAGDAFEEGHESDSSPAPAPIQGTGFTAAADRGKPGTAEPPNSTRAAPLVNFPTEADD